MTKILVAVSWPYANGPIHVGQVSGSYLPPDIFARYHRMKGDSVLMVSGSDQHGTSVTIKAEREHSTPERVAEKYHSINLKSLEWLGISFDLFTKTHTENHFRVARDFFTTLLANGYIYSRETSEYYCSTDRRFLADTYVVGICPKCGNKESKGNQCDVCGTTFEAGELIDARCVLCGNPTVLKETVNLFYSLSKQQDKLSVYLSGKGSWKPNVIDFSRNWLSAGLTDRAATRDLDWGIPVPYPGMEKKVIYVWFEAVIGYISASVEWAAGKGNPEEWKEYWQKADAKHYYFMGKDNVPFHTIIWPSMLMAHGGLELPYHVSATEWVTPADGRKFSKSRGGAPTIDTLMKDFSPEQVRYYLTAIMPEGRDSEFSMESFETKVNNELVATLGNYYHRVLSFAYRNFGSLHGPVSEDAAALLEEVSKAAIEEEGLIEGCEFKKALKIVMDTAQKGNQYLDRCAPWFSLRSDRVKCMRDLYSNLELIRHIAIMSHPFLPFSSAKVLSYLGIESNGPLKWSELSNRPGTFALKEPSPVFSKIELKEEDEDSGIQLDLRVGQIKSVRKHPAADKLYLMEVDIGERRQIVAGLKEYYTEEQLEGKRVVVVSNLATAKLRGYESQGMMLAAEKDGRVRLLSPPEGTPVGRLDNCSPSRTITIDEFRTVNIRIGATDGRETSLSTDGMKDWSEVAVLVEKKGLRQLTAGGKPVGVDGGPIGVGAKVR